jgi:hypothetical protein
VVAGHQQMTREWWQTRSSLFDPFVSELVLEECRIGDAGIARKRLDLLADIPTLAADDAMIGIAELLVTEGPIPRKAAGDALHIAIATVYECDYLLTWNCRHIANAEMQRSVRRVLARHDLELPVICTPEELMGEDDGAKRDG